MLYCQVSTLCMQAKSSSRNADKKKKKKAPFNEKGQLLLNLMYFL